MKNKKMKKVNQKPRDQKPNNNPVFNSSSVGVIDFFRKEISETRGFTSTLIKNSRQTPVTTTPTSVVKTKDFLW